MKTNFISSSMTNEQYHKHPAVSRSQLWKFYSKTPAHSQEKYEPTSAMDFGSGLDCALLEPDIFDTKIIKGPEDRRGKKWSDLVSALPNCIILTADDYEKVLCARDSAAKHPLIRKFMDSVPQYQRSAFAVDEETGLELRVRPDAYSPSMAMMVDLKTSRFINKFQWEKQAADLGYHLQEPMYSEVWEKAGGGKVEAFAFFVVENEPPFSAQVFEFDPESIEEGKAILRDVLPKWKKCANENIWPGLPTEVQQVTIPRYAFKETTPFI